MILATANPKHGDPDKPEEPKVIAKELTVCHTTRNDDEKRRIEALGESVLSYKGVKRVVLKPTQTANEAYKTPKLNMTRSLGDLWSLTSDNEYIISPIPHVDIHELDRTKDEFIILGSDGLWNVVTPQMSIKKVYELCKGVVNNPAEATEVILGLISHAQQEWERKMLKADNIAVLMIFFVRKQVQEMSSPFREQHRGQPQNPIPLCGEPSSTESDSPHAEIND